MFFSIERCGVAIGRSPKDGTPVARGGWHICTSRWDITLASRTGADDIMQCWDAGAVAFGRHSCGERSLRVPFMGILWHPRRG